MTTEPIQYYVAKNGNDEWSGSLTAPGPGGDGNDGPFATLGRARDAVRMLKVGRGLSRPVEIIVREGTYHLDWPLRLSGGDSGTEQFPVTYMAHLGEQVVLSGGRAITDWRPHNGKIMCASLPEVRRGRWWFRQLFYNGKRMIRARWPKYDPADTLYGGWAFVDQLVSQEVDLSKTKSVELQRTWRFKTDPQDVGAAEKWFDPKAPDDDWASLDINNTWNAQSHERYRGRAWYRLRLTVPADLHQRKHLWLVFGGVIEEAQVYINGQKLIDCADPAAGQGTGEFGSDPFKFDVKDILTPAPAPGSGSEQLIAVSVKSNLEHGGLWETAHLVSSDEDVVTADLAGKCEQPSAFRYEPGAFPADWPDARRIRQAEVFVICGQCWISDFIPIREVDSSDRTVYLTRAVVPSRYTLGETTRLQKGNRFYVENALEHLTEPGEWCLDSEAGMVYFRPPDDDIEAGQVTAPVTSQLVAMVGQPGYPVHYVNIRGFTFTQSQADYPTPQTLYKTPNAGQALYMEHTEDCAVENNRFIQVGGDAIRLQATNARARIVGNEIADIGAYGIFVGHVQRGFCNRDPSSGDLPAPAAWHDEPHYREAAVQAWPRSSNHLISNNHIHDVGLFEKHASGIAFFGVCAVDVVVSHNLIHGTPRFGIGMLSGLGRIIVEYNHLHHISQETGDTGGITANRWYTHEGDPDLARGNIVRFNYVHDVIGCAAYAKRIMRGLATDQRIFTPYFCWAIYFDNGPMDVLVYGNVTVRNTYGGIMVSRHAKNVTVENNIFLDSDTYQITMIANEQDNIRYRRNIIGYDRPEADTILIWDGEDGQLQAGIAECDANVYATPNGQPITLDGLPGVEDPKQTQQAWRDLGYDVHSVTGDPGFVDAAGGDYSLRPDSPALKLGFVPIDMSRIGLLAADCAPCVSSDEIPGKH